MKHPAQRAGCFIWKSHFQHRSDPASAACRVPVRIRRPAVGKLASQARGERIFAEGEIPGGGEGVERSLPVLSQCYFTGFPRLRRLLLHFVSLSRRLRRAAFFAAKESGERNRQRGPIPRRSPLESLPDGQGGPAPLDSPAGVYGGRRTGDIWSEIIPFKTARLLLLHLVPPSVE